MEQIDNAQSDIDKQLTQLQATAARDGDHGALTQAHAQLAGLANLKRDIGRKDAQGLSGLRGAVAASVAVAQLLVQQVQSGAASVGSAGMALAQASVAARASVSNFSRAYYEQRIFDRYLSFASAEDEEEYRKRESERRREIEKAQAEHTPHGDLRASRLAIEQLKDAGAHGADRSPEYRPMLQGLTGNCDRLAAATAAEKTNEAERGAVASSAAPDGGAAISPEMLAAIRDTKIAVADPSQEGHGVTQRYTSQAAPQRSGR